ncbi:MAG: hypothetical protein ABIL58_02585 [Pseudomonadota bacterium]
MTNRVRSLFHPWIMTPLYLGVIIVTMAVLTTGCGMFSDKRANRQVIKATLPDFDRGKLTNTALFFPYENATQRVGGMNLQAFHQKIVTILRNDCKKLKLITSDDPKAAALMARLAGFLRAGDSIGFSEAARASGIAAMITGRIADVATEERSWGIWWFTSNNYYLNVQVDTSVYDVETGAKTVDVSLTEELKIDGLEYDAMTMGQSSDLTEVDKLLDELAKESAQRACQALNKQPWIGFVTAVDKDRVTLVPGSAAGLTTGMKLHIYGSGTLLDGNMGQPYFVPGLQRAAIEVVSVEPDRAFARILSGSMVALGDSVRRLR